MATTDPDLDLFLAGIEAKLKQHFTPLELTKVITTPALRGNHMDIATYVKQLLQVFHRTDKVIQMKILIALAGLVLHYANNDKDDDAVEVQSTILEILRDAQQSRGGDEWVPSISGLLESILFTTTGGTENDESSPLESRQLLDRTCQEIIENIKTLEEETAHAEESEEEDAALLASRLTTADVDPTTAPYRYSLLKPEILKDVIPEAMEHSHFKINQLSKILLIDMQMEATKAQEEAEHTAARPASKQQNGGSATNGAGKQVVRPGPIMPGMSSGKKTGLSAAAKAKIAASRQSSMFLSARKPSSIAAATGGLHVRKAGASQRLVGKGRQVKTMTVPNGAGNSTLAGKTSLVGGGGRAAKLKDLRASKMKVLDVTEVQDLANVQKDREQSTLVGKKGLKRKADAQAMSANKTARTGATSSKKTAKGTAKATGPAAPVAPVDALAAGVLAAAALSKYQTQVAAVPKESAATAAATAPAPPPAPLGGGSAQLDWRQLLALKSNKLSDEDRSRIKLFFEDRKAPSPGENKVRIKLHEERITDPNTREPIKETYYLNLDYTNFTSNQSKKRKRYND